MDEILQRRIPATVDRFFNKSKNDSPVVAFAARFCDKIILEQWYFYGRICYTDTRRPDHAALGVRLPIGVRTVAICEQVTLSRLCTDAELQVLCLEELDRNVAAVVADQVVDVHHTLTLTSKEASLHYEITCLESIAEPQAIEPG